jgi:integrase
MRPTFTPDHIKLLLEKADPQMKAMIWLGLNCGFGCTDCSELLWENLGLKEGRVCFPRGKTGVERNLPLWFETVNALKRLPRINERVFNTRNGNPWVRTIETPKKDGTIKYTPDNSLAKEFAKLTKKAGVQTEKGMGFYTLRRTAATLAAKSGDPFAVQRLLGHADLKMASTYVQNICEQTDRVIIQSHNLIVQDNSESSQDV